MPSLTDFLRDPDEWRRFGQGLTDAANRGMVAATLGAPVDMATQAVNLGIAGAGYAGHKLGLLSSPPEVLDPRSVPGSSEWIGQKMQGAGMVSGNRNALAEVGMGLLSPVALKGAQKAGGLLASAEMRAAENAAKPSTLRQAGQRGIFAGEWAKTADKAKLKVAQELDAKKADPRAIWDQTGWFKGGDGKWRFEIDDSGSAMKGVDPGQYAIDAYKAGGIEAMKAARAEMEGYLPPYRQAGRTMELSDVFSHHGLLDAYPDVMQRTKYSVAKGGQIGEGGYSPRLDAIELTPADMQTSRSGMLHEIQHAIQEREGFAKGGSVDTVVDALADGERALRGQARAALDGAYRNDPLAQAEVLKPGLLAKARGLESQANTYKSWLSRIEGFPDTYTFPAYQSLAGEAEARAVQARMNFTPEQRRAVFPLDSYDVPVDSLIFRY